VKVLAALAVLWLTAAAATYTAVRIAARRRPRPDEAVLVLIVGEPTAWVLTDLGVAVVPAPTDLAGVDLVLARAMDGRL